MTTVTDLVPKAFDSREQAANHALDTLVSPLVRNRLRDNDEYRFTGPRDYADALLTLGTSDPVVGQLARAYAALGGSSHEDALEIRDAADELAKLHAMPKAATAVLRWRAARMGILAGPSESNDLYNAPAWFAFLDRNLDQFDDVKPLPNLVLPFGERSAREPSTTGPTRLSRAFDSGSIDARLRRTMSQRKWFNDLVEIAPDLPFPYSVACVLDAVTGDLRAHPEARAQVLLHAIAAVSKRDIKSLTWQKFKAEPTAIDLRGFGAKRAYRQLLRTAMAELVATAPEQSLRAIAPKWAQWFDDPVMGGHSAIMGEVPEFYFPGPFERLRKQVTGGASARLGLAIANGFRMRDAEVLSSIDTDIAEASAEEQQLLLIARERCAAGIAMRAEKPHEELKARRVMFTQVHNDPKALPLGSALRLGLLEAKYGDPERAMELAGRIPTQRWMDLSAQKAELVIVARSRQGDEVIELSTTQVEALPLYESAAAAGQTFIDELDRRIDAFVAKLKPDVQEYMEKQPLLRNVDDVIDELVVKFELVPPPTMVKLRGQFETMRRRGGYDLDIFDVPRNEIVEKIRKTMDIDRYGEVGILAAAAEYSDLDLSGYVSRRKDHYLDRKEIPFKTKRVFYEEYEPVIEATVRAYAQLGYATWLVTSKPTLATEALDKASKINAVWPTDAGDLIPTYRRLITQDELADAVVAGQDPKALRPGNAPEMGRDIGRDQL